MSEAKRARYEVAGDVCRDFENGKCMRGSGCKFLHQGSAAGGAPGAEKEVCREFLQGRCDRGMVCKFAHPGAEPVEVCRDFKIGRCDRGSACRFSHDMGGVPMGGGYGLSAPIGGMAAMPGSQSEVFEAVVYTSIPEDWVVQFVGPDRGYITGLANSTGAFVSLLPLGERLPCMPSNHRVIRLRGSINSVQQANNDVQHRIAELQSSFPSYSSGYGAPLLHSHSAVAHLGSSDYCKDFRMGKCNRGDRCKFPHV
mmetsp:Transcript_21609/g.52687  ORF Transcript_21609/g.52687 Transcript_21609/m.52687 type:complete len:254 (+) Transcript_21609:44-805(+)